MVAGLVVGAVVVVRVTSGLLLLRGGSGSGVRGCSSVIAVRGFVPELPGPVRQGPAVRGHVDSGIVWRVWFPMEAEFVRNEVARVESIVEPSRNTGEEDSVVKS